MMTDGPHSHLARVENKAIRLGRQPLLLGYGIWPQQVGDVLIADVNFPDGDALDLLPRQQKNVRI